MMWCDACNRPTPLRVNIEVPRRMGVCDPCYRRSLAGEQLQPAHGRNHDQVERRRRPEREVRTPEQFR